MLILSLYPLVFCIINCKENKLRMKLSSTYELSPPQTEIKKRIYWSNESSEVITQKIWTKAIKVIEQKP